MQPNLVTDILILMSTQQSTIDFLTDQLSSLHAIRLRKMFGEYALYCDEKVVGLVCDDELFIKITEKGKEFVGADFAEGTPYPGAKPYMQVGDKLDNTEWLCKLIKMTADALPLPKPKRNK